MTESVKQLLSEFRTKHSPDIELVSGRSEALRTACIRIERSWSGSFAGWHGLMYFRDFEVPSVQQQFSGEWGGINGIPTGWEERQPEEVRAKLEELVGKNFSADRFEADVNQLRKHAEDLRSEIDLSLGSWAADSLTEKEKALVKEIESFSFGKTKNELIKDGLPGRLMSRDMEALRQGTCIPSWLYYDAVATEAKLICDGIERLTGLSDRLIRWIEKKPTTGGGPKTAGLLADLHPAIYDKCHELYEKLAYAEAVEKGFKVVRDRLRKLTGYETGSEAFGKGKLYIEGAAATNVEQDFNDGVKFLTMAIDRFRNEKSHTSDARIDDPMRAYEYLRLSSLAMHLLENTRILP